MKITIPSPEVNEIWENYAAEMRRIAARERAKQAKLDPRPAKDAVRVENTAVRVEEKLEAKPRSYRKAKSYKPKRHVNKTSKPKKTWVQKERLTPKPINSGSSAVVVGGYKFSAGVKKKTIRLAKVCAEYGRPFSAQEVASVLNRTYRDVARDLRDIAKRNGPIVRAELGLFEWQPKKINCVRVGGFQFKKGALAHQIAAIAFNHPGAFTGQQMAEWLPNRNRRDVMRRCFAMAKRPRAGSLMPLKFRDDLKTQRHINYYEWNH